MNPESIFDIIARDASESQCLDYLKEWVENPCKIKRIMYPNKFDELVRGEVKKSGMNFVFSQDEKYKDYTKISFSN